ncbi:gliding motility protein GldO [Flavobacterium akiainvivens]|uniref:Gliding motility protein GldO n=1 Tax=Flavobacterium akiainvivens TaxID=1202724 RepID=A0A0M8MDA9_9FLAO|nr:gliding motility protein GldN [Flavobacterium akiainvivens]KOS07795.1 gliding motility protein GldO [Flavobacterium akiainvivens]SFQ26501.1 protein involved in gliding motility GldN [Flavobacterium akiainvivens]
MNRKIFLSVSLLFAGVIGVNAQSNILNAKTPDEIGKKTAAQDSLDYDKPLPYGYVGDRDMLFAKRVWEVVDLDQRINFPMYFPTEDSHLGDERQSLFGVLTAAMDSGKLTEVYEDSYFTTKVPPENVKDKFFFKELNGSGIDLKNQYPDKDLAQLEAEGIINAEHYDTSILQPSDVTKYKVMGIWYFDKRQGELKYRILGICPMAPSALDKLRSGEGAEAVELFWVFYPGARDVLHKAKAFNERNSAMPITFDHLLNSRRFSGTIVKEENVMGDRLIEEYMRDNSQMQLLEAERVKDKIRNFEQDMWNY